MKSIKRRLVQILKAIGVLVLLFALLMLMPRTYALLFPSKPPVGYQFEFSTFLAIGTGLERLIEREPPLPETILEIKDIEYKSTEEKSLQIDFYKRKDLQETPPLLVFIHGGGWRGGKRADYRVYLLPFAEKGYVTATVSYRLVRDKTYPACAEDISDAMRFFFENGDTYGYDPDRIAVIGGSAGGHLAMLAAYGWPDAVYPESKSSLFPERKIKAVVNIYGPVDLTTPYARNHPLVTNLIAQPFDNAAQLYAEASPITYLNASNPPTLIFHGTADSLVPVTEADILKEKLTELGVPVIYHRLPLWPHTMDLAVRVNRYFQQEMSRFFDEYL